MSGMGASVFPVMPMAETDLATLTLDADYGGRAFFYRKDTSDEGVIKQAFVEKEYDLGWLHYRHAELMDFVRRRSAGGDRPLIVDAGANIGATAVFFSFALPDARIVAIEPVAENVEVLRQNAAGLPIEVVHAALASTPGRSRIVDPGHGHWGFRTAAAAGDQDGPWVPNVTIPEIYARHRPGFFPVIVKIDVEGAEGDIFREATQWVQETPVVVVELHDWLLPKQRTSAPFLKVMAELDRDFVALGESVFSITNDFAALG